jgi:hypothetical protein
MWTCLGLPRSPIAASAAPPTIRAVLSLDRRCISQAQGRQVCRGDRHRGFAGPGTVRRIARHTRHNVTAVVTPRQQHTRMHGMSMLAGHPTRPRRSTSGTRAACTPSGDLRSHGTGWRS